MTIMYAIIRDGKGGYYTSTVFGYYCPVSTQNSRKRRLESIHNQFFVVLSKDKKRLVKKEIFPRRKRRLDPLVLIVDEENEDWIVDEEGHGCVDFLTGVDFEAAEAEPVLTAQLLERCIQMDSAYIYQEYQDVRAEKDLRNLSCVAGGFHDAYIETCRQDGTQIYVLFDGIWGCKIEIWFEGEAAYSVEAGNPGKDPIWYSAALVQKDGFYYLVDDDSADVDHLDDQCCWFRGRSLRYHVIPNH